MNDDLDQISGDVSGHFEPQFRTALDNLTEGFQICAPVKDSTGTITDFLYLYVNDAMARMAGLNKSDMIGKKVSLILKNFRDSQLFSICYQAMHTVKPIIINSAYVKEFVVDHEVEGYYDLKVSRCTEGLALTMHDVTELKRKGDALLHSEENYRLLFEESFDALFLTDPSGKIYKCNAAARKLFGYSEDEMCSLGRDGLADPTDDNWQISDSERKRTGKYSGILKFRKKDGTVFSGEVSSAMFTTMDGAVRSSIIIRDITARLKAEQQIKQTNRQLQDMIDGSSSIIFVKDLHGRYLTVNRRLEEMLGLTSEEIRGKTDFDILPRELAEHYREEDLKIIAEGNSVHFEEETHLAGEREIYVLTNKFPLYDEAGSPYAICGISTDITVLKNKDKELKKTIEALRRSNEELEQFAYIASHDLQEPLRMVSSFAKLLEIKYKGNIDEKAGDYIRQIVGGAKRMSELINDLLSFSRISSNPESFTRSDLNLTVTDVLRDLQLIIKETSARIDVHPLPVLRADAIQIKQLFQNLIQNALKFRRDESPVITINAKKINGEYEFSIQDNGIGIKPEYHDRIFMLFQRLHEADKYPGTGLGLAICRKIVERHGGRIWLTSEEGRGTTFYFTLPGE